MKNIVHARFESAQDGIEAVESLLHHGVRAEDISLILPQSEYIGRLDVQVAPTGERAVVSPDYAQVTPLSAAPRLAAERAADALLPPPPQLERLFPRGVLPHDSEFTTIARAPGYRYDALGAIIRDPESKKAPASSVGSGHEVVLDTEQGAGLGMAVGLLTAMCVPGIGLIADFGTVAGLMTAGAVAGSLAGGIYGYLVDRGIDHEVARKVSDHLAGGGTTLSVVLSDSLNEAEIVPILQGFGGHLIAPFEQG